MYPYQGPYQPPPSPLPPVQNGQTSRQLHPQQQQQPQQQPQQPWLQPHFQPPPSYPQLNPPGPVIYPGPPSPYQPAPAAYQAPPSPYQLSPTSFQATALPYHPPLSPYQQQGQFHAPPPQPTTPQPPAQPYFPPPPGQLGPPQQPHRQPSYPQPDVPHIPPPQRHFTDPTPPKLPPRPSPQPGQQYEPPAPALPPRPGGQPPPRFDAVVPEYLQSKPYFYQPLQQYEDGVSEIRLLEIIPSTAAVPGLPAFSAPADANTLRVRLIHVRLEESMPYYSQYSALSYSWGDSADRVPVICNDDSLLMITRSLFGALMALRDRQAMQNLQPWQQAPNAAGPPQAPQPHYFWSDAICINQENPTEKRRQVPLMRRIYEYAGQVLVWLGEDGKDSEMAFPIIPTLAAASKNPQVLSTLDTAKFNWGKTLGFTMPQLQVEEHLRAFFRLLRREWFTRAWIIQEYAVAPRVKLLCGRHEIDDFSFVAASTLLISADVMSVLNSPWIDNPLMPLYTTRAEQQAHCRVPLLNLLQRFRPYLASNPRDKVFSLVGLACDIGPEPGGLNLQVDYEKSEADVFRDLVINFFYRDRNLDIMVLAGIYEPVFRPGVRGRRLAGIPSWVPDFALPDQTASVTYVEFKPFYNHQNYQQGIYNNFMEQVPGTTSGGIGATMGGSVNHQLGNPNYAYQLAEPTVFHASKDSVYTPYLTPDRRGLIVRGQIIDTIDRMALSTHTAGYYRQFSIPDDWWKGTGHNESMDGLAERVKILQSWIELIAADPSSSGSGSSQGSGSGMSSLLSPTSFLSTSSLLSPTSMLGGSGSTPPAGSEQRLYFTGETMLDVLWQCMLGGHFGMPWEQERQNFMSWYNSSKTMRSLFMQFNANRALRSAVLLAYSTYKTLTGGFAAKGSFMTRANGPMGNRAMFVSRYGYIGMAPQGSRQGDSIVLLEGSRVPFLLRRQEGSYGNYWQVVGASYVHGLMQGHLFDPTKCVDMVLV